MSFELLVFESNKKVEILSPDSMNLIHVIRGINKQQFPVEIRVFPTNISGK